MLSPGLQSLAVTIAMESPLYFSCPIEERLLVVKRIALLIAAARSSSPASSLPTQ
jgi:hypothetical protein